MQSRCYKTILILFLGVAVFLALSIPVTAYAGNPTGSSSGYRSSQDVTSNYRRLNRSRGKHSTHKQNSRKSHIAAIKKKNPGEPTSGNGRSNRFFSSSSDLDKSQRQQSSSRQKRNHKQRENVDKQKKQGYISHDKRPGTIKQQINNGRNDHSKTRKIPVALISKQKNPVKHTSRQNKPVGHTTKQNNHGESTFKQKNLVPHKNQGLTKSIKPQANRTQLATIRPDKYKRYNVTTNPLRSLKQSKATRQHRNHSGKQGTVFQTQHKQHNSHSLHNQQRHHGHRKHHRHFTHSSFSPYVFFSYSTLYSPYSYYPHSYYSFNYYPFSYYSGYYPYAHPFYGTFEYISPPYSYEEPVYLTSKPYGIDSPGWFYLGEGNFQAAINVFAKDIHSFPDAGIPKVGLALASAAAGNLAEGVLVMREAFNVDPDSIHYLYFDKAVSPIIDDLIEKYEYELKQNNKRPDEAFMVSALHYLKYDYGYAHEAINRAITDGDKSPSLGKLHRLVDEQFSNEYAEQHN